MSEPKMYRYTITYETDEPRAAGHREPAFEVNVVNLVVAEQAFDSLIGPLRFITQIRQEEIA